MLAHTYIIRMERKKLKGGEMTFENTYKCIIKNGEVAGKLNY